MHTLNRLLEILSHAAWTHTLHPSHRTYSTDPKTRVKSKDTAYPCREASTNKYRKNISPSSHCLIDSKSSCKYHKHVLILLTTTMNPPHLKLTQN